MSTINHNSKSTRFASRFKLRCLWATAVLVVVIGGTALAIYQSDRTDRLADTSFRGTTIPVKVHSLGRLEPQSRVIRLSSPTAAEGSRIEQLTVREGDALHAGQVVAVLDTHDRRKSALEEAEARVRVAQAKLLQIKAGAKPGDIVAQQSVITRCRFVLKNAEAELERSRKLAASRTISESDFEQRKLQVERSQQDLEQAQATLESLQEVRQVDIDLQQQEIESAIATATRARADLDATLIKTPIVSDKGVMEIGQIDVMYVVAEVYEADISRIRIGQSAQARLTGSTISIAGQVEEIGLIVGRKDVLNNDPVSDTDARVVEVRVRLDSADSSRVSGFSNARCEITFEGKTESHTAE